MTYYLQYLVALSGLSSDNKLDLVSITRSTIVTLATCMYVVTVLLLLDEKLILGRSPPCYQSFFQYPFREGQGGRELGSKGGLGHQWKAGEERMGSRILKVVLNWEK